MIVRKSSNDICATCYEYHMWQKGGGMFCHGVEAEEEEKVDDDSVVDPDYKKDYDRGDDWDPEKLLVDSEEKDDDDNNNNNNNMEEDADGYTASEHAYMNAISIIEDDVDIVEEDQEQEQEQDPEQEEEKDERYYLKEEKALENVAVINKLRLHINEAQSM